MKRLLIPILFLFVLVVSTSPESRAADAGPNFIVFLADDLGWGDLACYGHLLNAGSGEAVALKKLDSPIQESATFTLSYRAAKGTEKTRNACFCFGSSLENDALFKAGSMIGMNRHGIFQGTWANHDTGSGKNAKIDPGATIEARVTIDLERGKAILVVGDTTVEHPLPDKLESVTHVGIYAKETRSEFTMPKATNP